MTDHDRDIADILTDADRVLLAACMLPNDGSLTELQRRQVMTNFTDYIRRHGLTVADVGRQLGTPRATTIMEMTQGCFRTHGDEHVRRLNVWVEQNARQRAVSIEGKFVTTRVAKDMLNVARLARENSTMAMVLGPTGIGKTRCAQAIAEKYVGSIYIRIIAGSQHPKGLTSALAERLKVRKQATYTDRQHHTQIERVIESLRDTNRLIMLDEAGKLKDSALELVRDIHDVAGVPFLLIGTSDLYDRIIKRVDADHGQLYSRFDIIRHLTQGRNIYGGDGKALYTLADIRELYSDAPLKLSTDAEEFLRDVANQLGHGSLRRCRVLVQNGARRARKRHGLADGESVTVTADDLDSAERILRMERFEQDAISERRRQAASAAQA